ncbi:uncharacterized protein TEOVI_000549400 [Trypanosoma equiperdum]|uniref:Trypanosome variant surface glycoprotein (A-type) n=1 Tax=Trypanosoma equiperdum TaxID=5694 RepID=A0A1G4I244_TRYEQ|nr:hypothetical protein, conserved [Trypanosoma equiperdum]
MKAPTLIVAAIAGLISCLSGTTAQAADTETDKQSNPCAAALYIRSLASELEKSRTAAVAALNTAQQDRMVVDLALAAGDTALSRPQLLTLQAVINIRTAAAAQSATACTQSLTTIAKLLHREAGYQWAIDTLTGLTSGANTKSALTVRDNNDVDETTTAIATPNEQTCKQALATAKTQPTSVNLKGLKQLKLHKLTQPAAAGKSRTICHVKCGGGGSCNSNSANAGLSTLAIKLLDTTEHDTLSLDPQTAGQEDSSKLSTTHTELKDHRHHLQWRLIDFLNQNPCNTK